MNNKKNQTYLDRAIQLAADNAAAGAGGPFGCVIVKNGEIIAEGTNLVTSSNDPTAHAEMVAIRNACSHLSDFQLTDCEIYTSCEPCPMCLGAIYWARPKAVYFAATHSDAAAVGFDDQFIYEELEKPVSARAILFEKVKTPDALRPFNTWAEKTDKTAY